MCRAVTCRTCAKITWSGCGQHVDDVMRNVEQAQRCTCEPGSRAPGGGLLARLLGR